jgi:tetratricopeptide (TPR) repeat protein
MVSRNVSTLGRSSTLFGQAREKVDSAIGRYGRGPVAGCLVCVALAAGCGPPTLSQAELHAALLETLRSALATEEVGSEGGEAVPTEVAFDRLLEKGHRRRGMLAVSAYLQALRLRPDSVEAYLHCGSTLDDMGDRDRAVAIFRKVLQLDPENVQALCLRGRARLLDGDEIGAKADFERASGAEPDHPLPLAMLGVLSHLHGDLVGAKARYAEARNRARPRLKAGGAGGMRQPYLAEILVWCNLRLLEEAGADGSRAPADPSSSPLPPSPLLSRERERLVADINFDGTADLMLSDSRSTFGRGGGRFTVWLGSPDGSYESVGSFVAHSGSMSLEKVGPGRVAVHTYTNMSAGSGLVSTYFLAENRLVLVQRRMIYPYTEEGSKECRRLFEKRGAEREVSTTEGDTVSWAPWH